VVSKNSYFLFPSDSCSPFGSCSCDYFVIARAASGECCPKS
jgi:hypothetical protein